MIYLASAYTHFDRQVMAERYERTARVTALLFNRGHHIYSPIVHCHELSVRFALRHDFEFWRNYNEAMLDVADELWVYDDPQGAWMKSTGVRAEIEYMQTKGHQPMLVGHSSLADTISLTPLFTSTSWKNAETSICG